MLDARKQKTYNENKVVTMVGPGTLMTGEVKCKGTIRVEGAIDGKVYSEDSVVVLESGRIKGDISAGQVIINGEVLGNIVALHRIEITARGKVIGDISAPRISIHEGVLFEGQCTMKAVARENQKEGSAGEAATAATA